MKISVHPLFFAVIIFCAFFGGFFISIIFALTALLHECGHAFCAAKMGYRCTRIKLMPYGAAAVCEIDGITVRDEIALALAGPAVNGAICVATAGLWWFFPQTYAYTDAIMTASLAMLVVNLLPAYPLDGGRVARCVLARLFSQRAADITLRIVNGLISAALFVMFFLSGCNITYIFFSLFLLCAAFEKSAPAVRINFSSPAALRRGVEVKCVLVGDELTFRQALRYLDDRRYLILKCASSGREISQDELYELMCSRNYTDKVFD